MFDHVGIVVADLERALAFYDACLRPLGLTRAPGAGGGAVYVSADRRHFLYVGEGRPNFWGSGHGSGQSPIHLCLTADDRDAVDAFHAGGLATGGVDNGQPGFRGAGKAYYAAYMLDPDGNNVEASVRT